MQVSKGNVEAFAVSKPGVGLEVVIEDIHRLTAELTPNDPVRNGLSNPRGINVEIENSSIFWTESRGCHVEIRWIHVIDEFSTSHFSLGTTL